MVVARELQSASQASPSHRVLLVLTDRIMESANGRVLDNTHPLIAAICFASLANNSLAMKHLRDAVRDLNDGFFPPTVGIADTSGHTTYNRLNSSFDSISTSGFRSSIEPTELEKLEAIKRHRVSDHRKHFYLDNDNTTAVGLLDSVLTHIRDCQSHIKVVVYIENEDAIRMRPGDFHLWVLDTGLAFWLNEMDVQMQSAAELNQARATLLQCVRFLSRHQTSSAFSLFRRFDAADRGALIRTAPWADVSQLGHTSATLVVNIRVPASPEVYKRRSVSVSDVKHRGIQCTFP